jgi:hypothetical protein
MAAAASANPLVERDQLDLAIRLSKFPVFIITIVLGNTSISPKLLYFG